MFKIGQKVVCVSPVYSLIKDEIYTINNIHTCKCGVTSLELVQIKFYGYSGSECSCGKSIRNPHLINSIRFRPIDYTFGEKLAEEIQEEINQEQLINA